MLSFLWLEVFFCLFVRRTFRFVKDESTFAVWRAGGARDEHD